MNRCKCGSYAITIDPDNIVCDVCFYKDKYIAKEEEIEELIRLNKSLQRCHNCKHYALSKVYGNF